MLTIEKTEKGEKMDGRALQWTDKRIEKLKEKGSGMSPEDVRAELKSLLRNKRRCYRYRG